MSDTPRTDAQLEYPSQHWVEADFARQLEREGQAFGSAIAEAAKRSGIYNGEGVLDGPTLLLLLNDMGDVLEDRHRLVRELDVAMHGEDGAAKQASLCDLIPLAKNMRRDIVSLERELAELSRIVTSLGEELQEAQLQRAEYRERAYEAEGALSDPALGFGGEEIEEEDGFGPAVNKP